MNRGFLDVPGDVLAETAALFSDNDPCSGIMGYLVKPFVFTKYHSVRAHGALRAQLPTGDDPAPPARGNTPVSVTAGVAGALATIEAGRPAHAGRFRATG
jgi:hypothetical protein